MSIILTKNFEGGATENFTALVKERAVRSSQSGSYDFIYIVPTRRRVRELQREFVDEVVFGKFPIYTLELFSHEIFSLLKAGRRTISSSMQGMLVSGIISSGDFKFFKYASFRPGARRGVAPAGTIKKVVDQIDYLKENGITPQDYKLMLSASEESERQKLEEFLKIYSSYENSLGKNFIDNAGVLSLVNSELKQSQELIKRQYPNTLTFFVEGFYNFKKPELEFLKILSSRKEFSFLIKLDCSDTNENLFKTMLATSADLVDRGFKPQKTGNEPDSDGSATLKNHLGSNLFADKEPGTKIDLRDKVFVVSVRDNLREAEFVAEKIKEIIKKNPGQELDKICVASYLPQNYSQMFREVFPKYRIPTNITDRYTLESNSVVNALLSFIDIRISDYERAALLRAITNRVLTVSSDMNPNEAGSVVYNAAAICRFERGLKNFRETIAARLELYEKLGLSEGQRLDSSRSFGENTDDDAEQIARNTKTLKDAQRLLNSIERKLAPFNRDISPEEFRGAVKSLVNDLRIYQNIARLNVERVSTEIVERDARALSSFFEVLDEAVEVEVEKGGEKLPIETRVENLRSALSLTRYNVRQKYGYGVYVTALEEIRGLEFDYMFIVGLNEGELPAKYNPEIFLPLSTQKENRETQPYLQRHLFYQAASSFEKNLFLIYPVQTDDVRLTKSSFIDAFTNIAEVTRIDKTAGEDGLRNIYNIEQLVEIEAAAPDFHRRIDPETNAVQLFPPNLERCKAAESARYKGDRNSEFDGKITEVDLVNSIDKQFADRVFSAAQIQSLSRCGFQYFVQRILRIAEVPEIETSLSTIERGAVLHKILYRFYNELSKTGKLANAKDELRVLLNIGREVLDELGIQHDLFEVERDTILGTGNVPGTLELFLTKVQTKLSEYGFTPEKFELEFGMKSGGGNATLGSVKIGDVALRGKIDRIDSNSNGLTIFDYKTSSQNATHQDVIGKKISPQLILYLDALDKITRSGKAEGLVAGAAFISINRDILLKAEDGKEAIEFIVSDEDGELKFNRTYGSLAKTRSTDDYPRAMNELLKETDSFVNKKVSEARSGRFNLTTFPREKVCSYCSYSEACRIALTGESFETDEPEA